MALMIALYSAVRLLGKLSLQKENLAAWYDRLPVTFSTSEMCFECKDGQKFAIIEKLCQQLDKQNIPYIAIDGVRVATPYGCWLLRASDTQDILTARLESTNEENFKFLEATFKMHLQAADGGS